MDATTGVERGTIEVFGRALARRRLALGVVTSRYLWSGRVTDGLGVISTLRGVSIANYLDFCGRRAETSFVGVGGQRRAVVA
jgi:shikimate 5-dehydrogenase